MQIVYMCYADTSQRSARPVLFSSANQRVGTLLRAARGSPTSFSVSTAPWLTVCLLLCMFSLISTSPGSVYTTPAPVVCSAVTNPSLCNNYCQWQYFNPNSSATNPPGGWVGYCRNRTCSDYGSAECMANNATCASYGDETVNFDFACYTRGMPPACSTLRSNSSCNYFSSSCYWIAEAFQCLQKGTCQP